MNPTRKGTALRSGILALAFAAVAGAGGSAQTGPADDPSGTATDVAPSTPFVISLWPATGRPDAADRTRAERLERFLGKLLKPLLAETGYSSFWVEVLPSWDAAADRLREDESNVVECDPVLYFLTIASLSRLQSRYSVLLQTVEDPMPRGLILAPRDLGLTRPEDLQGRSVAFLDRIAGGAAQIQRALNERGLAANSDYSVNPAGYFENALENLDGGLVDAVAVSSDLVETHLDSEDLEGLSMILETEEILPPLFAARRSDLERFPAFANGLIEALRSFYGPERVVLSGDDLYERAKEEGLPWE